jgi:hypothetical protein
LLPCWDNIQNSVIGDIEGKKWPDVLLEVAINLRLKVLRDQDHRLLQLNGRNHEFFSRTYWQMKKKLLGDLFELVGDFIICHSKISDVSIVHAHLVSHGYKILLFLKQVVFQLIYLLYREYKNGELCNPFVDYFIDSACDEDVRTPFPLIQESREYNLVQSSYCQCSSPCLRIMEDMPQCTLAGTS